MSHESACPRNPFGDPFSPEEMRIVRSVVNNYWRTSLCLRRVHEVEDLIQECLIHWWQTKPKYDGERGASLETYLRRVTRNRLLELSREARTARRRVNHKAKLFSKPVTKDPDEVKSFADLAAEALPLHEEPEAREREVAVLKAVAALPPRQQTVAIRLGQGVPVAEIAREIGVGRDTIYADKRQIGQIFKDNNLEELL